LEEWSIGVLEGKSEARNSKHETISNDPNLNDQKGKQQILVSDFEIRISKLSPEVSDG